LEDKDEILEKQIGFTDVKKRKGKEICPNRRRDDYFTEVKVTDEKLRRMNNEITEVMKAGSDIRQEKLP
jgi:hypothetical protein